MPALGSRPQEEDGPAPFLVAALLAMPGCWLLAGQLASV